jgi:hypothetical protein
MKKNGRGETGGPDKIFRFPEDKNTRSPSLPRCFAYRIFPEMASNLPEAGKQHRNTARI